MGAPLQFRKLITAGLITTISMTFLVTTAASSLGGADGLRSCDMGQATQRPTSGAA